MTACRASGEPLEVVLDLGRQPLGNGFLTGERFQDENFFDLRCGFSESSYLFQLIEQPSAESMFHDDYAFITGTSRRMVEHFTSLAISLVDQLSLSDAHRLVVELGCNDGTFLAPFAERGIRQLGVEPSGNVAEMAQARGINVMREFFSPDVAESIKSTEGSASLVYSANVMCHINEISGVAEGIANLLAPGGVLIFEDPYLGDVIEKISYDQIYDEHVFLFSALSVQKIFEPHGLELIAVENLPVHGGSMRYTLAPAGVHAVTASVAEGLARETALGMRETSRYLEFAKRVQESAVALRDQLAQLHGSGASIAAYGATSKSTTVYNYADIGPDLISRVYDNTPTKIGKFTPGKHIPVVDEQLFLNEHPDVAYLGAWNHQKEIRSRNHTYAETGGRWLTHVPRVEFLED
jgi:methylation protein EvaC